MMRKNNIYTSKQVGDIFEISRQTLYNLRKEGKIKVNKDWHGRLIWDANAIESLNDYLNDLKKKHNLLESDTNDMGFRINNRRYLGSKERLLPFIKKVVNENTKNVEVVADIFGGTGVVSDMFARNGKKIIVNDLLHSNYVAYQAFFGKEKYNPQKIKNALKIMNNLKNYGDGYIIDSYGDKYFSLDNSEKIDSARQWVENNKNNFNSREFSILLTSILYASDKVANTVGHYDAYRKKMDTLSSIIFKIPLINDSFKASIFNDDANHLVRNIRSDLVYIDTPYNSRQYVDTYHVLENIIDWKKPPVVGIARKSTDRSDRKSKYNLVRAPEAFDDLITNIDSRYIVVSFNNMAKKGSGRSNSKISNEEIINSLSKRGNVRVFSQDFTPYTTGKSDIKNHKELLYFVEVER